MTAVSILPEVARWRSRDVRYFGGTWDQVRTMVPRFELADFSVGEKEPANPFLKAVVRLPLTATERPMPVGTVSRSYALVQHEKVGELCFAGMAKAGVNEADLKCEVGLSDFGEWMNLRIYFPERFGFTAGDGRPLALRVEAFNSVDGSSRLAVLISWLRLVCSNGLVVRESIMEIKDVHDANIDLSKIADAIQEGIVKANHDKKRLSIWHRHLVTPSRIAVWADTTVSDRWGKKAATRVFHICMSASDVELADPFESKKPTEKTVHRTCVVPGAPERATNLYDVCQALSWVATNRSNAEQRVEWQSDIPFLIKKLAA